MIWVIFMGRDIEEVLSAILLVGLTVNLGPMMDCHCAEYARGQGNDECIGCRVQQTCPMDQKR
jgi:hypothetical protein